MNFLPYNTTPLSNWLAAASGSAVVHAGVLVAAFGMWQTIQDKVPVVEPAPDFKITVQPLDANTPIGNEQPDDIPEVEPDTVPAETPEVPPVDPATPSEPQEASTSQDPVPPPVPATPDPDPDNSPPAELPSDSAEPEPALTPPPIPDPIEHTPVILYGTGPGQMASPNISEPAAGFNPITTGPADGGETGNGQEPVAMLQPTPTRPTVPDPGRLPTPDGVTGRTPNEQDLALRDLIQRIRTAPTPPCLIALPRRDGTAGVGLALIGAEIQDMVRYSEEVLTDFAEQVQQTRTLVDPRQCPALSYVASTKDYPASRLGIRLDSPVVPSGGRLSGVVRGVAGKSLLMLVIDADGVVQDLDKFTTINGNFARFEVPVSRTGPQRDTAQLLLILATPQPATTLRQRLGDLAQVMFAGLDGANSAGIAMAITTFDVR